MTKNSLTSENLIQLSNLYHQVTVTVTVQPVRICILTDIHQIDILNLTL